MTSASGSSALVWFRRDLRDYDHAALYYALKHHTQVYCAFVFDTAILDALEDKADRRLEFIWESLRALKAAMQQRGGDILVRHGRAGEVIPLLAHELNVCAVYSNRDYEPIAIARDQAVQERLAQQNIRFHQYKDQVLFEQDEVMTQAGKPYGVFTPYKNAYLKKLNDYYLKAYPVDTYWASLAKVNAEPLLSLESLGFLRTNLSALKLPTGMQGGLQLLADFENRIHQYHEARNFPAVKGVSYLSVHLRFGTVSIRHLARIAFYAQNAGAECWLSELIWRDFYAQVLYHRPDLQEGRAYKLEYDALPFPNNKGWFQAWCEGETGYPIVDAAMRQLNQTGYMHNRLRMIAASFLVKDLLVDWRWGEHYFAQKLIDFDFSSNNGGWQWAASTGCDAQPYFRIFNPTTQSEKFDSQGQFIRKYLPELTSLRGKSIHQPWQTPMLSLQYAKPIVEHSQQRALCLALYKSTVD